MTASSQEIPLIDLAPWYSGGEEARERTAIAVDRALQDVGFLLIANHAVDPGTLAGAWAAASRFFHLSRAEKSKVGCAEGQHHGWRGIGTESHGATFGMETGTDLKESFSITPPDSPADLRSLAPRWFAENRFPAAVPELEATWRRLYTAMDRLANELLRMLELSIGAQPGRLTALCGRPMSELTANWYPAYQSVRPAPGQFRIGPHTDFGTITLLDRQHGTAGLQIQTTDGDWTDAPFVPGTLTVNVGDLLQHWSGNRWRSTRHRVPAPSHAAPQEELLSVVYFHAPDYDAVIEQFGALDARAPTMLAGEYLDAKSGQLMSKGVTTPP